MEIQERLAAMELTLKGILEIVGVQSHLRLTLFNFASKIGIAVHVEAEVTLGGQIILWKKIC